MLISGKGFDYIYMHVQMYVHADMALFLIERDVVLW